MSDALRRASHLARERWGDPLRRSADALILGTALTSLLGLAFWALAARWMPADAVGIGAALISVVTLLANVATLGMRNGLLRFLPAAGPGALRFIGTSYLMCALAALAAGAIFLLGQPLWAQQLGFLRESPLAMLVFAQSIAVWVIFVLQDQVLIALRHALWVPVENSLASALKILALPLAATSTAWAIYAATLLPALLAVLAVSALLIATGRKAGAGARPPRVPLGQVLRFAIPDHVATLLWLATLDVLTLLVLHVRGAEASAYWFMACTVGYSLYLVTSNVGSALLAESVRDTRHAVRHARKALLHSAQLVIPAALLGMALAPWALGLLGAGYAAHGTGTLQFILASTIPQLIVGIGISTARLHGRMRTVLGVYAFTALMLWGGATPVLGLWGLPGLGALILCNQLLIAIYFLLSGRSGLSTDRGWPALGAAAGAGVRVIRRWRTRRRSRAVVPGALECLGIPGRTATVLLTSDSDTLVLSVAGVPDAEAPQILKIAISAQAAQSLAAHVQVLRQLHGELGRLGPEGHRLSGLVPRVLRQVTLRGQLLILETQLDGVSAARERPVPAELSPAALELIGRLHQLTGSTGRIGRAELDSWVQQPLAQVASSCATAADRACAGRLAAWLDESWNGASAQRAFVHGDLWPGNLLLDRCAQGTRITGLADWETGNCAGLPDTDLIHWWLCTQPGELGQAVVRAVADPGPLRAQLAAWGARLPNEHLGVRQLLILTWLIHVAAGLNRASANRVSQYWFARNALPVLRLFAALPAPTAAGW